MSKKLFAAALALCGVASPALAATPPAKPCAVPEQRQFDFWVGKWEVYQKTDATKKIVAHSLIESVYDGCAVRENWMPLKGNPGGSLNAYEPGLKQWRQFWADSQGGSALFNGGWDGSAMVLTGTWPQPGHPKQMTRMRYSRLADGSVEQFGTTSDDGGKTWQPSFDFIYRKAS